MVRTWIKSVDLVSREPQLAMLTCLGYYYYYHYYYHDYYYYDDDDYYYYIYW